MKQLIIVAFAAFSFAGCARNLGEFCSSSDECMKGTTCVQSGGQELVNGSLGCNENKRLCSTTCNADSDCAALGSGLICMKDCFQGSCLKGSR